MFFIAGPCALESKDQVIPLVEMCLRWGIPYFRAQLFKPRTHPNSFQGLGVEGLPIVNYIQKSGLKLVAEACSEDQLMLVAEYADIIQVGARNMQNFELLKKMGGIIDFSSGKKVLLKRGFGNTLNEWVSSAEYLLSSGVPRSSIILCERGTRNAQGINGVTLDFAMALQAKRDTNFPVIIDPSHGTRESSLVLPLAELGLSSFFDGLMVEVHPYPERSMSDAQQAVSIGEFEYFLKKVGRRTSQVKSVV